MALCDVDWGLPRVKENFTKHPNAKRYKDFREMLDKEGKAIDAVNRLNWPTIPTRSWRWQRCNAANKYTCRNP